MANDTIIPGHLYRVSNEMATIVMGASDLTSVMVVFSDSRCPGDIFRTRREALEPFKGYIHIGSRNVSGRVAHRSEI